MLIKIAEETEETRETIGPEPGKERRVVLPEVQHQAGMIVIKQTVKEEEMMMEQQVM